MLIAKELDIDDFSPTVVIFDGYLQQAAFSHISTRDESVPAPT